MSVKDWFQLKSKSVLGVLIVVCTCVLAASQTSKPAVSSAASKPAESAKLTAPLAHNADTPDILRETQLTVGEPDYAGLVWWIPFEFWQESAAKNGMSREQSGYQFRALKDYTIVGVFVAKISALGAFDFVHAEGLQKSIVLRDASGKEYGVVKEPAQDAKNLAAIMKPILSSAMGKAGENFELLFFPARAKDGEPIADANQKGRFAVVLKDIAGVPESVYEFRLPLTSLTPAKYCPVGKERVHADWDYCPYHGVALNPSKVASK